MSVELAQAAQHFNGGIIFVSFLVSVIGAQTTLLLLSRRTHIRGAYNWFLLVAAALTMGSVGVWTMHFIGNHSLTLTLANEGENYQMSYGAGYTVASLIVAVACMFIAFAFVGISEEVRLLLILPCGIFAGSGVACMHYLGQFAIKFFILEYTTRYIIAAVVIASAAVTIALYIFFRLRQSWKNQWHKSLLCAILMAVAVCGMHYTAMAGTNYRYPKGQLPPTPALSAASMIGILIAIVVVTCIVLIYVSFEGNIRKLSIHPHKRKASRLVVDLAIFDKNNRLMVQVDGTIPSREVAPDLHKLEARQDFSVRHPLFVRLFKTVLCWPSEESDTPSLYKPLTNPPDEYNELEKCFEQAACELRDVLRLSRLADLGILFDSVVLSNTSQATSKKPSLCECTLPWKRSSQDNDISETNSTGGRWSLVSSVTISGSLGGETLADVPTLQADKMSDTNDRHLFLMRKLKDHHEALRLMSLGYRFADPVFISKIMGEKLSIPNRHMLLYFKNMQQMTSGVCALNRVRKPHGSTLTDHDSPGVPSGIYVGLFALIQNHPDEEAHTLVDKQRRGSFPVIQLQYLDGELPVELNEHEKNWLQAMSGQTLESVVLAGCDTPATLPARNAELQPLTCGGDAISCEAVQRFVPALRRTATALIQMSDCIRSLNSMTSLQGNVIDVPSFAITPGPCKLVLFSAHVVEPALISKVNFSLKEPIKCVPLQLFRPLAFYITDRMVEDFRNRHMTTQSPTHLEQQRIHFVNSRLTPNDTESIAPSAERRPSDLAPSFTSLPPPPRPRKAKYPLPFTSHTNDTFQSFPPPAPSIKRPSISETVHEEMIDMQPTILEAPDRFWWLDGLISDTMRSSV